MISLWIAAILVVFALGLAHRVAINLRLSSYQKDRLKAYYLAKAGVNQAIALMEEDKLDPQTKDYDSLSECGINLKGKEPQDYFSQEINGANEGFAIGYYNEEGEFVYGILDEDRKVPINSTAIGALLELKEIDDPEELDSFMGNWTQASSAATKENKTEIIKNEPLKAPEELLLVLEYFFAQKNLADAPDKASEVYTKIKDSITIYADLDNMVNINTASEEVLTALARAKSPPNKTDTADILAKRIIEIRDDPNTRNYSETIDKVDSTLQSDKDLRDLFIELKPFLKCKSDCFKIQVYAYVNKVNKKIYLVYDRGGKKIVYWHEN